MRLPVLGVSMSPALNLETCSVWLAVASALHTHARLSQQVLETFETCQDAVADPTNRCDAEHAEQLGKISRISYQPCRSAKRRIVECYTVLCMTMLADVEAQSKRLCAANVQDASNWSHDDTEHYSVR